MVGASILKLGFIFLRDQVSKGNLELEYCNTEDQIADMFTNPLKADRFRSLRNKLRMYSLASLN